MQEDAMDSMGHMIKSTRQSLNMSQGDLAKKAGVTQQTLSRIESGDIQRSKATIDIAIALSINPLIFAKEDDRQETPNNPSMKKNNISAFLQPNIKNPVHIFNIRNVIKPRNNEHAVTKIETPSWLIQYVDIYGVIMPDDSMMPLFQPESILIIDPKAKPKNKDAVVLAVRGSSRAIVTNYIESGSDILSIPSNLKYPSKYLREKTKYLGVVITVIIDRTEKLKLS
jgi:transcriptional regulator with XRE-family HTH domain